MSARRIFLSAALFLLAAPGWAQAQAQSTDAQSASAQSTTGTMSPSSIGDRPLTVTLVKPTAGEQLVVGTTTPMWADAEDEDDMIQSVWFQVDGTTVSTTSSGIGSWVVTAGSHSVRACASNYHEPMRTACTATITVTGVPNQLPAVSLTSPANGAVYRVGTAVPMAATASDTDGSIASVEFWVDGAKVATKISSPYAYNWTATAGSHTLQAKAVDNLGGRAGSATVGIAGNIGPTVTLTSPTTGATYTIDDTVAMTATASDADGTIVRAEFWIDGVKVAQDATSPYAGTWNPTVGDHVLQAKAQDDDGARIAAPAITIHVAAEPIVRTYTYNAYQELCGVHEPETGTTLMGYDGAGNLAWSASGLDVPAGPTDPPLDCAAESVKATTLARKATRTYDARNRIATLSFPDLNGNQSWSYTPDGLPASVTTYNDGGASSVVNSYLYNRRRLPVSETQQVDSLTYTVGYGYDANGHLSTLAYPDSLSVAYAPNALGQPTQAGSYATGVQYYPNGAIKQFTYGNGIVHTLTQNARGLPAISKDAYGTTVIHQDEYAYDPVGNVLAITDAATGQNQRGNRDMVYDDLNRLTSATSPMFGTATYAYDELDNLTHVQVTSGSQPRNQDYFYDGSNRLTNVIVDGGTGIGLGYDVQGNLSNKNGVLYTFDYGNRLRAGGPETYRYDVQGRRARSSSSAGLVYSLYAQSGQLLFQRDERSGKRRQYVYLGGSLVAESDVPLAGGTATVTYQHTDALGSPVATTNASKTVLQRSEYEPYGYLLNRPMQDGPGYTGHVTDAATGLVYMQQRYYDPLCGCFLSVDPVTALKGPFNRYWYANANPYRFTDPDGREIKLNGSDKNKSELLGQLTTYTGMVVTQDKDGSLNSISCSVDQSSASPVAGNALMNAINSPNTLNLTAVKNDSTVFGDSYTRGMVDVGDISGFAEQSTKMGAAIYTHIFAEYTTALAMPGGQTINNFFAGAHAAGTKAEAPIFGAANRIEKLLTSPGTWPSPGSQIQFNYVNDRGATIKSFIFTLDQNNTPH